MYQSSLKEKKMEKFKEVKGGEGVRGDEGVRGGEGVRGVRGVKELEEVKPIPSRVLPPTKLIEYPHFTQLLCRGVSHTPEYVN